MSKSLNWEESSIDILFSLVAVSVDQTVGHMGHSLSFRKLNTNPVLDGI